MSKKVISFLDIVPLKANCVGKGTCDIYETIKTKEGFVYKKTNTINRQAIMDSEAKNCDISILYKRLIKGDGSVLQTREGVYLNMVNAPKDILEMNNYSKTIEKYFYENKLLQQVYKGDFNSYFVDYQKGLDTIKTKIDMFSNGVVSDFNKRIEEAKKKSDEVKKNENK